MLVCAFMQAFCAAPQRDSLQLVLDDSPSELGHSLLPKHHSARARTALRFHLHCTMQVPAGMAYSASHLSSGPADAAAEAERKTGGGTVPRQHADQALQELLRRRRQGRYGRVCLSWTAGRRGDRARPEICGTYTGGDDDCVHARQGYYGTHGRPRCVGEYIRSSVQRSRWRWWCWWLQQHTSALRQVGLMLLLFSLCARRWAPERPCRNRTQDDQACPQADGGH